MTITLVALGAWLAGPPEGSRGLDVGVVVEETAGRSAAVRQAARREVATHRAQGRDAQLRIARSPSEALAAAATLATRGAGRIVLISADPDGVVAVLERERPDVRLDVR